MPLRPLLLLRQRAAAAAAALGWRWKGSRGGITRSFWSGTVLGAGLLKAAVEEPEEEKEGLTI